MKGYEHTPRNSFPAFCGAQHIPFHADLPLFPLKDPYANAFKPRWRGVPDWPSKADRGTGKGGWVAERKYGMITATPYAYCVYISGLINDS